LTWNGSSSETPDLDLIALVFDKFGFVLECCFWGQKSTSGNALFHSGDCRPGTTPQSDGRNEESIFIDLARLPPHQHSVALCVVSSSGQPFSVANAAEVTLSAFSSSSARMQSPAATTASPSKRRPITPVAPISSGKAKQGKTVGVFSLTAGKLNACQPKEPLSLCFALIRFCSGRNVCIDLLYNAQVFSLNPNPHPRTS
jgi:hypothetical protein